MHGLPFLQNIPLQYALSLTTNPVNSFCVERDSLLSDQLIQWTLSLLNEIHYSLIHLQLPHSRPWHEFHPLLLSPVDLGMIAQGKVWLAMHCRMFTPFPRYFLPLLSWLCYPWRYHYNKVYIGTLFSMAPHGFCSHEKGKWCWCRWEYLLAMLRELTTTTTMKMTTTDSGLAWIKNFISLFLLNNCHMQSLFKAKPATCWLDMWKSWRYGAANSEDTLAPNSEDTVLRTRKIWCMLFEETLAEATPSLGLCGAFFVLKWGFVGLWRPWILKVGKACSCRGRAIHLSLAEANWVKLQVCQCCISKSY